MAFNRVLLRVVLCGSAGGLFAACGDQPPLLAPDGPSFSIQGPCGHIFYPCEVGGIKVVVRRQPLDPVQWPLGRGCSTLPGGCFPPGEPPIVGAEPYYNMGGGLPQTRGTENGWTNATLASGSYKASIQLAIRRAKLEDVGDACEPLLGQIASRMSWGIYVGSHNYGVSGQWVGEEPGGTVYFNTKPGYLWDSQGNVLMAGEPNEPLLNAVIEEMIHLWFDTDIGHSQGSDSPEKRAAFDAMRKACGKWGY